MQDNYEEPFLRKVYLSREVAVDFVLGKKPNVNVKESFRITYRSKDDFKAKAKKFGIMFDFKVYSDLLSNCLNCCFHGGEVLMLHRSL